jgi:hypothetical protein
VNPLLSPPAPSAGTERSSEQAQHGAAGPAGPGGVEPTPQAGAAQGNGALSPSTAQAPDAQPPLPAPAHSACAHCGAPLQEGQHWCLQCGAAIPGSLDERPNWRPLVVLGLIATLLLAGAAVATAAALNKHNATPPPPIKIAQAPPVVNTTPPVGTSTTPSLPATPGAAGGTTTPKAGKGSGGLLFPPTSATKPPKIPAPAATPEPTGSNGVGSGSTGASKEPTGSGQSGSGSTEKKSSETGTSTNQSNNKEGTSGSGEQPNPILLDTNAATTYNPYKYPEAGFGDPALAIDGEPSTAWTAAVQPSSFPKMAEGLLIDLRSPTKLGSLEIRTPTPGMTIQVYGASGKQAPTTITEPGWTPLVGSRVLKKKLAHLKLHTEGAEFRFVAVWIVKAPAASQGTAAAPGHVALSEVSLYPPAS